MCYYVLPLHCDVIRHYFANLDHRSLSIYLSIYLSLKYNVFFFSLNIVFWLFFVLFLLYHQYHYYFEPVIKPKKCLYHILCLRVWYYRTFSSNTDPIQPSATMRVSLMYLHYSIYIHTTYIHIRHYYIYLRVIIITILVYIPI